NRMKRSKRPLVLTVNGRAELIVQDARSFQALLELADRVEAIGGISRGLESMARGEGRPAEQGLEDLRRKTKIPARRRGPWRHRRGVPGSRTEHRVPPSDGQPSPGELHEGRVRPRNGHPDRDLT